jgi:hypothetical protein
MATQITVAKDLAALAAALGTVTGVPSTQLERDQLLNNTVKFYLFKVREVIADGATIRLAAALPRGTILPQSYIFRSGSTVASLAGSLGWQGYLDNKGNANNGSATGIASAIDIAAAGTDTNFAAVGSGLTINASAAGWDLLFRPTGAATAAGTVIDIGIFLATEI